MKIQSTRARLLASSMICGAALAVGGQAFAQPAAAPGGSTVGEIVVTGSRIPQPNLTSSSPIQVVGSEDVKLTGTTQTADLLNQLPQVFAGESANISNGSTGTANVNLRGLGSQRTLVLIDGRRLGPGDPTFNGGSSSDINFIPAALVDHVEVLSGGASAVYGSDAVAGVVNFIMMKNFEGVRLDVQGSTFEHGNNNAALHALGAKVGDFEPTGSIWDGRQVTANFVIGMNTPDGKGNATVYGSYLNTQPILQSHRDYSACTLAPTGSTYRCQGSGTTYPVDIISVDQLLAGNDYRFIVDRGGPGNTLRDYNAATDTYNFGPVNYYQRQDERYSAGAYAHYEVNNHFDAYAQLMFMDDYSVSQAAPSGIFGQTFNIACDNPMLSAQEVATLCVVPDPAGVLPPTTLTTAALSLLRRNVEGGGRNDLLRHTDYRIVIGSKGEIAGDWNYDIYGLLSRSIYSEEFIHDMSLRNIADALTVTRNGAGNLVCASGNAGCVPYDIFAIGGVTPAALNYIQQPGFKNGFTSEMVLSASANGSLPLKSPWANDKVQVAIGSEYRRENLTLNVDSEFASGDLSGQGGPTGGQSGAFQVYELYGEARIPLVQDMPFFKSLSLDTGYRFSDYIPAGITSTYKFAADWQPVDDIRFRASYERAVRAPNVLELFLPQQVALLVDADPCVGATPADTQAQCLNTGVPASAYGHLAPNSAPQYNGLQGGNPNLKPEKADTYSVGAVLTPHMLPGFSASVDYFNIKVNNIVQPLDPNIVLNACAQNGTPSLCALVHRVPSNGYSLWLGTAGYVVGTNVNAGFLKTSGIDVDATYRLPLSNLGAGAYGSLLFHFTGTYLLDLIDNPGVARTNSSGQTVTEYDCAGLYGVSTCGTPSPKWRHEFRTTWRTPWSGLEISGQWRYFGSVNFQGVSTNPFLVHAVSPVDAHLSAQSYFDLSAQMRVHDRMTFRLGVNNIADKAPPLVASGSGGTNALYNGNTYPGVYDALGRYLFAGFTADF